MSTNSLHSSYHYVRFSLSPPSPDAVALRKSIQDALTQSFGLVSASTYVDILWVSDDGAGAVVRIAQGDAARLLASVAAYLGSPRLSVVKESPFLPSLLSVDAAERLIFQHGSLTARKTSRLHVSRFMKAEGA